MTEPPPRRGPGWRCSLHLAAFVGFLGLLTWKLLEPRPVPEALTERLSADGHFLLAKSLHLGAYAFLTVLAGTLPVPRYWRYYLLGLLALHAAATEILQAVLPFNRTGRVADVVIDWAGILVGVVVVRAGRGHQTRVTP